MLICMPQQSLDERSGANSVDGISDQVEEEFEPVDEDMGFRDSHAEEHEDNAGQHSVPMGVPGVECMVAELAREIEVSQALLEVHDVRAR